MRHLQKENIALCLIKINSAVDGLFKVLVTDGITDKTLLSSKDNTNVFPLYLYPEEGAIETERRPNLDAKIWERINAAVGHATSPEDIFDYIYGVLHSPAYCARYKEFLKVDFPRIPYPENADDFERFRSSGNRLRELHLMRDLPEPSVTFPRAGSMMVEQAVFKASPSVPPESDSCNGRVYINSGQYFDNVPESAWNLYIGGYRPAQKWLQSRKGRTLDFEDVKRYARIIHILHETARIMQQMDA